ncbi:GNAT family N-acetyltransferase [Pseudactinotalea sp. Z1739]|uniref:GNAT family N-acetyltransferase n=1 Tax=Pseudactinotalea sp. Z1739 TaxID=3413028 RepID=UPI003C7E1541
MSPNDAISEPSDVPVLSGDRVVLRAWRAQDREHLTFDEPVKAFVGPSLPGTDADGYAAWLALQDQEWADRRALSWCIAEAGTGLPLGWICLLGINQPYQHGSAEVAYWVLPESRGKGALGQALRLVRDYAFGAAELGLHRLWAMTDHRNLASQAVLRKAGYVWCGTERRAMVYEPGGGQYDMVRFELLADGAGVPLQGRPYRHVPTLAGSGIRLRPWRHADAGRVVEACTDPETQFWLPLPDPYTVVDAETYISDCQQAEPDTRWAFCVADADGDECIGALDVRMETHADTVRTGAVGYWMHPRARGRGAMTAALRLVIRYAFTPTRDGGGGLDRLSLLAADPNAASRRVATNAGMREVGRDRSVVRLRDDRVVDHVRYDLLAHEVRR